MKDIWSYPVSYGYGNVPGYDGFHKGEDRGNSSAFGLPVTVNGHTIGTVGWTGRVEPKNINGTHTHIGKWQGGNSFNPSGGGQTLGDDAVVVDIDKLGKTDNGKFVRVRSQGFDWVYLHLNSVNVNIGDKLKGGQVANPIDVLRMIAGEVQGFDAEVYNGKYDDMLMAEWGNDPLETVVREAFSRAGKHRYEIVAENEELKKQAASGEYVKTEVYIKK